MDPTWAPYLLGGAAALLVCFSKTGLPGAAIPAVAMMAAAFPDQAKVSVGAILPLLLAGDLFAISFYRRHADWRRLGQLAPFVVAGMVPAYVVLRFVDDTVMRVLIGIIILVLLAVHASRPWWGAGRLPDRTWFVALTGILAGFATTVSNAAGPVMAIYLISKRFDKLQFLGTAAWFFFFVNMSKVPGYALLKMMTAATLRLNLLLVPAVVVGAILGVRAARWVPQRLFDALVLVLAGAAAVRMIVA